MVKDSRKIAAILAADVVEYSRLMGVDEGGTLAALNIRRSIFDELVKEFDGHEFGSVGDSLMAEFPSAVNAVLCAQSIQRRTEAENSSLPLARQMRLRIGVNLGDVIEEKGSAFGDTVNVAARLQSLARPGGVLISRPVYDQVHLKIAARFIDAGVHQVKNIVEPVACYEVTESVAARIDWRHWPWLWYRGTRRWSTARLAIIVLLLVLGGWIFWHYERAIEGSPATTMQRTPPVPAATTAESRPSIAVLPFENRSRQEDDAFFVDGIHDDILTQLTKVGAMKVIARSSVEQFRKTQLTTREIGEKLGVMRVLEGGVQRAGDRVRVTVQLIDAATDTHLWAESYDRELTAANIFTIQSEVATAIAAALKTTLTPIERQSTNAIPTQSLDAWEAYQLGRQRMAKRTSAALADAEKFFRKAIEFDPKFALAYVGLSDTLQLQVGYSGVPRATALTKAEQAVATALKLDPNLAEAWASSASIADSREQVDRAETMYRRAIALNPNYAAAYSSFSGMLARLSRDDEALGYAERAVELDPLSAIINQNLGTYLESAGRFDEAEARYRKVIEIDPSMPSPYWSMGFLMAYVFNRNADAVPFGEKAAALDPGNPRYPCWVAGRYLDLGDEARATRMVQAARERWPDASPPLRISGFLHLYRGDLAAAAQDARKLLAVNSRMELALLLARDVDLQSGDVESARVRYAKAYPELFAAEPSKIDFSNWDIALDLVIVLQKTGASERASVLLDRIEEFIRTIPRMSAFGYGMADVRIYALRGQKREALSALREAEKAGYRFGWRYVRDLDPDLASIRNEPEFKAVFADIERDMARQRAELAARPKNAPLDLNTASN